MLGQPVPGRGQPDPAAVAARPAPCRPPGRAPRCCLRDARRRGAQLGRDLVHRPEAGELEQHPEAADVHADHCFVQSNGMSRKVTWTRTFCGVRLGVMSRSSAPRRRLDGDGVDALRPARAGRVGRAGRPDRRRPARPGCGCSGRPCILAGHRAAATVRSSAPGPARRHRARRRHGRRHAAVHGGRRPAAARHGERDRVPRPARRRRRPQPRRGPPLGPRWRPPASLLPDPPVDRNRRPGRRRARARRRRVLGGLHPAHPAGRGRRHRDRPGWRSPCRSPRWSRPRPSAGRWSDAHPRAAAHRPRAGDPAPGRPVHPGAARPAASRTRRRSAP